MSQYRHVRTFCVPHFASFPRLACRCQPPRLVTTLSMLVCVGLPVGFAWLAQRVGLGFLFKRPAWAHITPQQPARNTRLAAPTASA